MNTEKRTIRRILDLFHQVERCWGDEPARRQLLLDLKQSLQACETSTEVDLPFISRLHKHIHADIPLAHLCGLLVPVERKHEKLNITDEDFLVTTTDMPGSQDQDPMPVCAVLDNIRSAFNVGGIFRSADCLALESLVLCGYTATPGNAKVLRSAMGAHEHVRWSTATRAEDIIRDFKDNGRSVIALETVEGCAPPHETPIDFPCAMVLGNERFGLSESVLSMADHVITIPTYGRKNSLNVVSAFTVCGYELRRQWDGRDHSTT